MIDRLIYAGTLVFILTIVSWSQPYQLDWSHRSVQAENSEGVARSDDALERTWDSTPSPQTQAETMTVQITAMQSYDHYEQRYRKVSRIESLVYAGGYPRDVIHCNRASYDSFDIFLEDLEEGDRYKVRVTWDDGSHRTIEETIDPYSYDSVVVQEPLSFDTGFES